MSGNASEWALDWNNNAMSGSVEGMTYDNTATNWNKGDGSGDGTTANSPFIDPVYNTGSTRTIRGDSWLSISNFLGSRSSNFGPDNILFAVSFRVAVAATLP
jgi:formylglycine-generating enzyme required for sulfatase activity